MKRRGVLVGLGAVATGGLLFRMCFWKSEEDRVRGTIADLAAGGSFSRGTNPVVYVASVRKAAREAFDPHAVIDAPELGGSALRPDDLAAGAMSLASRYASATVLVRDLRVEVKADTATAEGHVVLTALEANDAPHVDERGVRFELAKEEGSWKIVRAEVMP